MDESERATEPNDRKRAKCEKSGYFLNFAILCSKTTVFGDANVHNSDECMCMLDVFNNDTQNMYEKHFMFLSLFCSHLFCCSLCSFRFMARVLYVLMGFLLNFTCSAPSCLHTHDSGSHPFCDACIYIYIFV